MELGAASKCRLIPLLPSWWSCVRRSALPDEMEEMESQSASTTEREATKLAVELVAQAKRELVESEFAKIAAEATEEQAAAAGAVLRVKGCTDKRVNGWYKESGANQSGKMTFSKADGTSGGIFFGKEVTGQLMWQIRLTSHYSSESHCMRMRRQQCTCCMAEHLLWHGSDYRRIQKCYRLFGEGVQGGGETTDEWLVQGDSRGLPRYTST
jgi:hypothetical protein